MAVEKFGRIGVLMGGPSSERQISLKSGRAVVESLKSAGCDIIPIDITSDDSLAARDLIGAAGIDCAFIALHGRFGEDGQVQQVLDSLGIPYTGSDSFASRLAMDKAAARRLFQQAGLHVPQAVLVEQPAGQSPVIGFPAPWVVKPVSGGSSIGLSIIEDRGALASALEAALALDSMALVEEYIPGRELTVGILDDQALPVIEVIPRSKFFDFQSKYQPGMTEYKCPADLDPQAAARCQDAGLRAHRALGCFGCSRVDLILDAAGRPFVLELNNIPGMTQTSLLPKAARLKGIDFTALCLRMLELAYEKKQR